MTQTQIYLPSYCSNSPIDRDVRPRRPPQHRSTSQRRSNEAGECTDQMNTAHIDSWSPGGRTVRDGKQPHGSLCSPRRSTRHRQNGGSVVHSYGLAVVH